jgi:formylglycine-generating enzyme required for sulfatase activity
VLHELSCGSLPSDRLGDGIPGRLGALVRDMSRTNPDLRPSAKQALAVVESLLAPVSPSRVAAPDVTIDPAPVRLSAERGATDYRPSLMSIPRSALGSELGGDEPEGLWVAKTPVTQGQYAALMGSNPAWFDEERGGGAEHPVESLSWYHAALYCNALSRREGLRLAYDVGQGYRRVEGSDGYRLPTEPEWRQLCLTGLPLAGADLVDDRRRHGWFCEDASGLTCPVGARPCNAWGLHDMWGNVAEWCDNPAERPGTGETDAERRPVMGGSFRASAADPSEVLRHLEPAGTKLCTMGFRVVATMVGIRDGGRT